MQPAVSQTGKVEKPNITIGVFPITNYGVVYLSLQQGFFQAEGLNVTPRVMGANPIAGIVGGDFDTGGVTWTAFLLATNRGIPLRPLSEADRGAKGTGPVHGQERFADQVARRPRWQEDRGGHRRRGLRSDPQRRPEQARVSTTNPSATPSWASPTWRRRCCAAASMRPASRSRFSPSCRRKADCARCSTCFRANMTGSRWSDFR